MVACPPPPPSFPSSFLFLPSLGGLQQAVQELAQGASGGLRKGPGGLLGDLMVR